MACRHRESLLVNACVDGKTQFLVDNTNLTRAERARYIGPASAAGFTVRGYFFQSLVADALARNAERHNAERVPDLAILGASKRMELPALSEGFDRLHGWENYEKAGTKPLTGETTQTMRRRLLTDHELCIPMKEAYAEFIRARLAETTEPL